MPHSINNVLAAIISAARVRQLLIRSIDDLKVFKIIDSACKRFREVVRSLVPSTQPGRSEAAPGRAPVRMAWAGLAATCLLQVPVGALHAQTPSGPASGPLPAEAVAAIPAVLDAGAMQELLATGSASSFFQDRPKVELCPSPLAAADITRTLAASHPNIGVQTLVVATMPARLAANNRRDLELYNLLHQFHTMEGIPYYSASHGQMRVFFTASYLVKGPGDRARVADPRYASIEPSHDFYLLQDDSTFGKNLYGATVKQLEAGAVELAMSNVEKVRYGVVPVLEPGALRITLVVQPSADGRWLYFYGNVGLKAIRLPGLETIVRKSFYNRTIAFYNWFAKLAQNR